MRRGLNTFVSKIESANFDILPGLFFYARTIPRRNFLGLVLRVIRPFVASGNFVSPIPFFILPLSLAQKGGSIALAFFLKTWQQRENIVAWSGRDKIACRNKDGMYDNDVLTDSYSDLSTIHQRQLREKKKTTLFCP